MGLGFLFQLLHGEKKQYSQGPNSEDEAAERPWEAAPTAVSGDEAAKAGVKKMHERSREIQRARFHSWSSEEETREIAKEMIEIHQQPLTLASFAYYTRSPRK